MELGRCVLFTREDCLVYMHAYILNAACCKVNGYDVDGGASETAFHCAQFVPVMFSVNYRVSCKYFMIHELSRNSCTHT
jgi:hypothetical protein